MRSSIQGLLNCYLLKKSCKSGVICMKGKVHKNKTTRDSYKSECVNCVQKSILNIEKIIFRNKKNNSMKSDKRHKIVIYKLMIKFKIFRNITEKKGLSKKINEKDLNFDLGCT